MSLSVTACDVNDPAQPSSEIISSSLASSVQVFADRNDGSHQAASGVVLSVGPDGRILILTAAHLLEPSQEQSVHVSDPRSGQRVSAKIVAVDARRDIAVIEAADLNVRPVVLKAEARLGGNVWVVSFPWGRRGTVVNGVISQIVSGNAETLPTEGPVGLIDATVSYGSSGGGVFDGRSGDLVGIVRGYRTAKLSVGGPGAQTLEFPIAGETTVTSTLDILCLLRRPDFVDQLPSEITEMANSARSCPDTDSNWVVGGPV